MNVYTHDGWVSGLGPIVASFRGTPYFLATRIERQSMYFLYNENTKKIKMLCPDKFRSIEQAIQIIGEENANENS